MPRTTTKDFSDKPGRRLRVTMHLYNPDNRQFRFVKGVGARVTVRSLVEQKRLWREIEIAIQRGAWRLPSGNGHAAAVDGDRRSDGNGDLDAVSAGDHK